MSDDQSERYYDPDYENFQDDDAVTENERYYDPSLDIDPDGFWTFPQNMDEMHDDAELHHPELESGDLTGGEV